jgi:hypothetical protein
MIVPAALVLLAAAASATTSPAGMYQSHQMEVAAGLELRKDGHFRYALEYGAVSETGEGEWRAEGRTVRLTSKPMPRAPSFELVRDEPAAKGELYMTLEDPGFEWGHALRAIAKGDSDGGFEISADDSGRVDLSGKPAVSAVAPEMPVYGPTEDVFALSAERGHRLLFRFHPNDLGRARFDNQPLERDGPDLLLRRYDTTIRFVRVAP